MSLTRITTRVINLSGVDTQNIADRNITDSKIGLGVTFMPTGAVVALALSSVPVGWLFCDGSEQPIDMYPELANILNTTYGPLTNGSGAPGTTHFRLPDYRGEFLRGWSTTYPVGSSQQQDIKNHNHLAETTGGGAHTHSTLDLRLNQPTGTGLASGTGGRSNSQTSSTTNTVAHTHTVTIGDNGGIETRPLNTALFYCIKT